MTWQEIRKQYPDKFIIMEGLDYHYTDNKKYYDNISILEICDKGETAWKTYQKIHSEYPSKEIYFQHTKHDKIEIFERKWLGVRL